MGVRLAQNSDATANAIVVGAEAGTRIVSSPSFTQTGVGDKAAFIGTSIVVAVMVDVVRLLVYGGGRLAVPAPATGWLVAAATLSAFIGSFVGARLVDTVTLRAIQRLVGGLLLVVALLLAAGVV